MYKLRNYQDDSVIAGVEILSSTKARRELLVLPTGAGKSIVIAKIVEQIKEPVIILQPSKELLEQNYDKFINVGGKASIYSASAGIKEIGHVTFATIGSIKKEITKLKALGKVKVIIDEAHIGVKSGSQLRTFLKSLGVNNTLGLTATPFVLQSSMNGAELKMLTKIKGKLFTTIAYVHQMNSMLESSYWTPIEYRVIKQDDEFLKVNSSGSDYTEDSMRKFYEGNDLSTQIVDNVNYCLSEGSKSILVFVPTIQEAVALSMRIPGSEAVSSLTPKKERDRIISGFKNREIHVVINVGILTTGFDYPELDTIILARSTMSFALYYQMIGRGVRIHENKTKTVVIDLSENFERFGKVEDFTVDFVEGYGWGLFRGESLMSNYPIDAKHRPQKRNLVKAENANIAKPVGNSIKVGDSLLPVGKYKNESLNTVLAKDKGYLVWMYENFTFYPNQKWLKLEIAHLLNLS
jgi:DNA repair protein RadD